MVRGRPARLPPFCLSRGRHVPRARRRSPPVRRAARAHVLHNPKQQLEATRARAREESVLGGRSAALSDDRQQLPTLQSESPRSYSLSPEKFTRSLEDWQTLTEPPLVISFVIAFLCDGSVDTQTRRPEPIPVRPSANSKTTRDGGGYSVGSVQCRAGFPGSIIMTSA